MSSEEQKQRAQLPPRVSGTWIESSEKVPDPQSNQDSKLAKLVQRPSAHPKPFRSTYVVVAHMDGAPGRGADHLASTTAVRAREIVVLPELSH